MMGRIEQPTYKLEVYHSIQLSYIIISIFGGGGARTHDLHLAKVPLYQLSYTPYIVKPYK